MTDTNRRVNMNEVNTGILQKDTLPMQVLNILMDWIMDGTLKMGEKLNTEEISRKLGVSRMPIREALSSLEKMGLAESVPYVGTRLVTLTQEDVVQIYMMRQLLEPVVAKNACEKISEQDILLLEMIHDEYVKAITADKLDAKIIYFWNRKFHFNIYSLSGMDRICGTIESLWDTLSFFKLLYGRDLVKSTDGAKNRIDDHQSYIDALKAGDSDLLSELLYASLQKRIESILDNVDFYTT